MKDLLDKEVPLTVAKAIKLLQKLPQDAELFAEGCDCLGPCQSIVLEPDGSVVLSRAPAELCGVIGEPEAVRKVCELLRGHDGYHQQGNVRWLGYHPRENGDEVTGGGATAGCVTEANTKEPTSDL